MTTPAAAVNHTVLQAVFALLVFAITAASIAESNKAASAVNSNNVNDLTGALSALISQFGRKLLATRSTYYYGVSFGSFLNFTMFVSISGERQQQLYLVSLYLQHS